MCSAGKLLISLRPGSMSPLLGAQRVKAVFSSRKAQQSKSKVEGARVDMRVWMTLGLGFRV